jgi:flagellar biosynthesis activator protein FlaF
MYQSTYAEIIADSASEAREEERRALDKAADLLRGAASSAPGSAAEREAVTFVTQLWGLLVKSLSGPDNDLPKPLRASLISVGLGVMAEANRINAGQSRDLHGLADICAIIRDGLH